MGDGAYSGLDWDSPRWDGITRTYDSGDVERLRGTVRVEYSVARAGAEKLWELLHKENYVATLGAVTGNQAVEMAKAGLKAIYLSGWQVAADANLSGQMYPDQSLYPANSVPHVVRSINNALMRADQIAHADGNDSIDWMLPIVADAEAGFGGVLNAFELMKGMIEAGASAVHFEDQLSSAKKCGHMGGKVLVPKADRSASCGGPAQRAHDLDRAHRRKWSTTHYQRLRCNGCAVCDREADDRGILRVPRRNRRCHCTRPCLRALRRDAVVRDVRAEHEGGGAVRERDPFRAPRETSGLQLLPFFPLEGEVERVGDLAISARTVRDGLSLPICNPGRISCAESFCFRTGS